MEIKFGGKYDKATFFKSVRLANSPDRKQRRFLAIISTFALISIGLLLYRVFESGDLMGSAILLVAAITLGGGALWPYLRAYFTARKMWANEGTRRPLQGVVTNQGITYILVDGRNEIRWERFRRVRKTGDLVALVRSDGLLLVFPRSFFNRDADWRKFSRLIDKRLNPSQKTPR
jgi:hypothetical protein